MKRRTCLLVWVHLIFIAASWARAADDPSLPFTVKPGVRQLFLDDLGIDEMRGLRRVLHQPRRHADNPLIRAEEPWENNCSLYGTALFDAERGMFRMWYLTQPRDRGLKMLELGGGRVRAPHTTMVAYAESPDGLKWTKPKLGQFPYDGDAANNLIDLGKDNCEGISVLADPRDPDPARRYKALYWDHGSGGYELRDGQPFSKDGPDDGLCAAVSSDGIHWQPLTENPILGKYCDTNQNLLFDPKLGRYVAFSRLGFGRKLARSDSQDFTHWSEPAVVLACDEADGPGAQIYGAGIDLYEGVYLAMIWVYHQGTDATIDTQLATSRDGVHWTRVADRAVWLPLGQRDSWEDGMARSTGKILRRGDELFIYYGGVNGAHRLPGQPQPERKHRGAIGLVNVPRDRFVSLDAEEEGTLVTKPFTLPAGTLHLNVDATGGQVHVALCDAHGQPLPDPAASQPIIGDQIDSTVTFTGGKLTSHVSKTVRLRLTMRRSKVFSYWFAGQ